MVQEDSAVHGLALTIRTSTESATFDLGGLPAATIESVVHDAFDKPAWPLAEMIRITLVVGAGKQARQKYDAQALKMVTIALQALGFGEDRGASCIAECAGLYKLQHDTGKNLKTVVVFPRIESKNGETKGSATDTNVNEQASLLSKGSLESKLAISTLNVFTNMVQSKCPTWSQKKALLQLLDDSILPQMNQCDQILITGQVLSTSQQMFYDSCRDLTDKRQYLQTQLQAHVDQGDLTKMELDQLKHQNEQRLQELKKANEGHGGNEKSMAKAQERHDKLHQIVPKEPSKLQHHAALGKLWKQLAPLQQLDESSNRLLSVHETQLLGKKMEVLGQIHELEQASRGWLEDEDVFEARLLSTRKQFHSQFGIGTKKLSSNKSTLGGKSSSSNNNATTISSQTKVRVPVSKWVTPTETKQSLKAKKKARLQKGDVFGAMMAADDDSSGDEDAVQDDRDQADEPRPNEQVYGKSTLTASSNNEIPGSSEIKGKSNKSKKKSNKKKAGGTGEMSSVEPSSLPSPNPTSCERANREGDTSTMISTIHCIFMDYLLPFILAVLTWLVGLVFGKPKPKKGKTQ